MKRILLLTFFASTLVILSGCSHTSIQQVYWDAGTSVALDEDKKGNYEAAEN